MKINHFVLVIFIFFYFTISCKERFNQNNTNISNVINDKNVTKTKVSNQQKDSLSINFLDKKYTSEYSMIIDESTFADHPIQTFLDCKDSYFTIHYIPKKQELKDF